MSIQDEIPEGVVRVLWTFDGRARQRRKTVKKARTGRRPNRALEWLEVVEREGLRTRAELARHLEVSRAAVTQTLGTVEAPSFREDPRVLVRDDHATRERALAAVLVRPASERLVTALAAVLVAGVDENSLPALQLDLVRAGVPRRLGWLVENTLEALQAQEPDDAAGRRELARARTWLGSFLESVAPDEDAPGWDPFDLGVRSPETQREVRAMASPISKRWWIESRLQAEDFAASLRRARVDRR